MELTRKQVIDLLEKADSTVYKEPKTKLAQALEYAISSLKTDETYQLMYEGGEIFTKADMVTMLTDIQSEIEICVDGGEGSPQYEQAVDITRRQVIDIIQEKINALKAERR